MKLFEKKLECGKFEKAMIGLHALGEINWTDFSGKKKLWLHFENASFNYFLIIIYD